MMTNKKPFFNKRESPIKQVSITEREYNELQSYRKYKELFEELTQRSSKLMSFIAENARNLKNNQ